ncbi:unnamed protein product [Linum tenue]|uniref:Uncharacterized protein n=1 Tax=Linum tenue TaxID=586396 RepID=A0AAV0HAT3_9ROSI|nr:unnamed protein product [Linum tenue]
MPMNDDDGAIRRSPNGASDGPSNGSANGAGDGPMTGQQTAPVMVQRRVRVIFKEEYERAGLAEEAKPGRSCSDHKNAKRKTRSEL